MKTQLPPMVYEEYKRLKDYFFSLGLSIKKDQNQELFLTAFVHKSYASDFKQLYDHNERLEFVGDAVLGSVIAKMLFQDFPEMKESEMTLYKIALVREEMLAQVAIKIWLNQHIFISNGEEKNQGREKASIVSDALEALIGYIFLDMGYEEAELFIKKYVYSELKGLENKPVKSYKTMAQERIQQLYKQTPEYLDQEDKVDEKGNVLRYCSKMSVEGKILATGYGTNKKKAQEDAAKDYCLQQEKREKEASWEKSSV